MCFIGQLYLRDIHVRRINGAPWCEGRKTSVRTKTLNGEVTNQSMVIEGLKVSKKSGKTNDYTTKITVAKDFYKTITSC